MGILNVTPDSFSDGGDHLDAHAAVSAGLAMAMAGAAIVDVGGESTRPGAAATPPGLEQARVLPVIRALAGQGVRVSVDTRNAATMAAALDAGAAIVNDVTALAHDPGAAAVCARHGCPVVLMHMRGTPDTMNRNATYTDLMGEVIEELTARLAAAVAAGIARTAVALDPGVGFAKVGDQNVELLRRLPELAGLGLPILVGTSRKRFVGHLASAPEPKGRGPGSLAAALFALDRGATILRVHDVGFTIQAVRVWQALRGSATPGALHASHARHG